MPVRKVNYTVEEARVGGYKEKDRLIMEIWTNGSLTPQEAIAIAATILVDLFTPLQDITLESIKSDQNNDVDPMSQIPIEELQLSVRAYNCLKRAQIKSVADLRDYTQEDLLEIKNFSQKSAEEVIEALQKRLGIILPQERASKSEDITLESIKSDQNDDIDPMSQIPIEELQLSVRAYTCLKRAQINLVGDLLDYTEEDLLEIKNFGHKSTEEVIEALQKRLGITLPQERASKSEDITPESIKSDQNDDIDPMSQIPIEELQLSVRAYNCLKRAQINSVADLRDYTQEDLLEIKNFGQKNAEEVIEALQKRLGITLPQERASKSTN
jgi:DNA-directed RNA polymerase alpha subunit